MVNWRKIVEIRGGKCFLLSVSCNNEEEIFWELQWFSKKYFDKLKEKQPHVMIIMK